MSVVSEYASPPSVEEILEPRKSEIEKEISELGADAVVSDCWVSMGDADEAFRHELLVPYQVNAKLMAAAGKDAIFMHCLPAHRGEEVTDDVIDGPQSVVFDEAENRLHVQKAILAWWVPRSDDGMTASASELSPIAVAPRDHRMHLGLGEHGTMGKTKRGAAARVGAGFLLNLITDNLIRIPN
jgi:Aspartate/ornithine carbamoyltransferase, Asp/Orn binding domain